MIYFDNAATTFPKPQCVYVDINIAMQVYAFNSGRGTYKQAQDTYKMIEETRELIANVMWEKKERVIFTSSATESINNIIYGLDLIETDCVFVSQFEHNAVMRTLKNLNIKFEIIPFDSKTWDVDLATLDNMLISKKPKAIIISQVSNITGYELPYEEIFKLGKRNQTINILDSSQSFGICNINKDNTDFVVFAGHKSLYAMFGIAGYINIRNIKLKLMKAGGTGSDSLNLDMPFDVPMRYEAGSMNSIGIYSIYSALNYLKKIDAKSIIDELTNYLISELTRVPKAIVYLPCSKKSHGIVSLNISGYMANEIGEILSNDYDICVRSGFHCCPFAHTFLGSIKYGGTVRVSLGIFNTKKEIDTLIEVLRNF